MTTIRCMKQATHRRRAADPPHASPASRPPHRTLPSCRRRPGRTQAAHPSKFIVSTNKGMTSIGGMTRNICSECVADCSTLLATIMSAVSVPRARSSISVKGVPHLRCPPASPRTPCRSCRRRSRCPPPPAPPPPSSSPQSMQCRWMFSAQALSCGSKCGASSGLWVRRPQAATALQIMINHMAASARSSCCHAMHHVSVCRQPSRTLHCGQRPRTWYVSKVGSCLLFEDLATLQAVALLVLLRLDPGGARELGRLRRRAGAVRDDGAAQLAHPPDAVPALQL